MAIEPQRSELDELIDWLENRAHNIKHHNIALPDRSVKTRLNWLACICMVEDEAQRIRARRQSAPEQEREA